METGIELKTGMVFWKDGVKYTLSDFSSNGKPYLRAEGRRVQFQDWREIALWLLEPPRTAEERRIQARDACRAQGPKSHRCLDCPNDKLCWGEG